MDKVDMLLKIRQLEKENMTFQIEIKQLKKQVRQQELLTAKLYTENERLSQKLSQELTKREPFDDYDEIIIQSKLISIRR